MSTALTFAATISITGDLTITPNLGTNSYSDQDVGNYDTFIVKNDGAKLELPKGNADYYTFVHMQTNVALSVYVNSSAGTAIPLQNVGVFSGGTGDITSLWVSNSASSTSSATLKVIYTGKLNEA